MPAHAHASGKIDWASFDGLLPVDCDLVDATIEPKQYSSAVIEVVLEASPQSWWWKGVQVPDGFGTVHLLEVGNSIKHASLIMPTAFFHNGQSLHFMKAGVLGLHTGMYDLGDLGIIPGGARVTFTWVQDRCPNVSGWLRSDESSVPDWLTPGEPREVTMTVVNNGGSTWHEDERYELGDSGVVDWGFAPMPVTPTLAPNSNAFVHKADVQVFTFVITAPPTAGYYELDVDVRQRGGGGSGRVLRKIISVQPTEPKPPAPPPPPPPPPKMVAVPYVLQLSAADAGKLIINAGLRQSAPFDPSLADPRKTVVAQAPAAGILVVEGFTVIIEYVLDQAATRGFAEIVFTNCRPGALELYLLTTDGWQSKGKIVSLRGDNGACPKAGAAPFTDKLVDGKANYYVVVDPSVCSDPKDPYCRAWEWAGWGDPAGQVFRHDL